MTSVVRHAGQAGASGFVRVIDGESKKVLMKSPVPESVHRAQDPNPRGGLRGARGISTCGDRLVVANTERLWIFDSSWKLVGTITHPWMGGIHDILAEDDGVWVTCTSADLLLKVDWEGRVLSDWEWRQDKRLLGEFGFRTLPAVDRALDYRDPESGRAGVHNIVHLNAVTRGTAGPLLSFGRILSPKTYQKKRWQSLIGSIAQSMGVKRRLANSPHDPQPSVAPGILAGSSSAIVCIRADNSAAVLKRVTGIGVPNHNVVQIDNRLVYNDSNNNCLVAAALDGNRSDHAIKIPGQPGFVRGLAQLDRDTFFVGSQNPAAVYQVDLNAGAVRSSFLLDGAPNESVYGICLVPPTFNDPPPSLGG